MNRVIIALMFSALVLTGCNKKESENNSDPSPNPQQNTPDPAKQQSEPVNYKVSCTNVYVTTEMTNGIPGSTIEQKTMVEGTKAVQKLGDGHFKSDRSNIVERILSTVADDGTKTETRHIKFKNVFTRESVDKEVETNIFVSDVTAIGTLTALTESTDFAGPDNTRVKVMEYKTVTHGKYFDDGENSYTIEYTIDGKEEHFDEGRYTTKSVSEDKGRITTTTTTLNAPVDDGSGGRLESSSETCRSERLD